MKVLFIKDYCRHKKGQEIDCSESELKTLVGVGVVKHVKYEESKKVKAKAKAKPAAKENKEDKPKEDKAKEDKPKEDK